MKRISFIAASLFALSMLAAAPAQAENAKELYTFYCAQCHGPNGTGKGVNVTKDFATDPRNFTNKVDMGKRSDDDIRNVIKSGGPAISKSALMPPWGATISDAQVELLLGYVRKFAK
jgi:mono/diheme cytochrome c family protein